VALVAGFYKGLVNQLASLGGVVLGIIVSRLFADNVGAALAQHFPNALNNPTLAHIAGGVVVYLVVYFTIRFAASMLHKLTHVLMMAWLDHSLGAIFSVFKWMLMASVLLNLWHLISPSSAIFSTSTLMDGQLLPKVMQLAPDLFGIVSSTI
jgi:membrane protein required for colicin V production